MGLSLRVQAIGLHELPVLGDPGQQIGARGTSSASATFRKLA